MIQVLSAVTPPYLHDAPRSKFPIIVDDLETSPFSLCFERGKYGENLFVGAGLARIYAGDRKPTPSHAHDTHSTDNDIMYVAHPQRGLAQPPQLQHFEIPYSESPDDTSYPAAVFPEERQADGTPPYNGLRARHPMPEVTDWTPHKGSEGTSLMVMLVSAYEVDPTWRFEAQFGECAAPCTVTMNTSKGVYYELALSVDVPRPPEVTCSETKVLLCLEARDATNTSMGLATLGTFIYQGVAPHDSSQSSPQLSRKRRLSLDVEESLPAKRLATQQMRAASESAYEQQPFGYLTQSPSLLSLESSEFPPPRAFHRPSSSVPTSTPSHLHRCSTQPPSWTPTPGTTGSPQLGGATNQKAEDLSPIVVNPKLQRTTTLQQSPSPSSTPIGTPATASFNPYAMLPYNKAILKINGDLEDMTLDWSNAEKESGRRLVHFWRNQTGSTINASFKPVAPEDRQPSFICISCIWWEAKDEHFVTSVDTIYLLENLVGGRFTVEEKNRIRRNLEGFRPLTVSKGKSDSEDFFKLIMGFPNPKPRNIEKDVKVFPWKILAHALKKIMGKYSASYSSMASALPQPPSAAATPTYQGSTADIQGLMGNQGMSPAMIPQAHLASEGLAQTYETSQLIEAHMASMSPAYTSMVAAVPQAEAYSLYDYTTPTAMSMATSTPMMSQPHHHQHHQHHHHHNHHQQPLPPPHSQSHPLPASHHHNPYGAVVRPASSASWDFSGAGSPYVESPVTITNGLDVSRGGSVGSYYTMPATDA